MPTKKGFTIIEMLVVVLIIGILAAISIPRVSANAEGAKITACRNNIRIINSQIERYKIMEGTWPDSDLDELVDTPDYFPDGKPVCPFGDKYVIDEKNYRVVDHKHSHSSRFAWLKWLIDLFT